MSWLFGRPYLVVACVKLNCEKQAKTLYTNTMTKFDSYIRCPDVNITYHVSDHSSIVLRTCRICCHNCTLHTLD